MAQRQGFTPPPSLAHLEVECLYLAHGIRDTAHPVVVIALGPPCRSSSPDPCGYPIHTFPALVVPDPRIQSHACLWCNVLARPRCDRGKTEECSLMQVAIVTRVWDNRDLKMRLSGVIRKLRETFSLISYCD